jgi:DNA-binding CsgD family transcriptional regulator
MRDTIDKRLSQSEKEVLELLLNDFSNEDIAGILGIGVKNVYNYTSRIRAKLKDLI